MAINLSHFTERGDPEHLNRVVGKEAIDDFLKTGVIRGTKDYGSDAFFLRGGHWAMSGNKPYVITVDDAAFKSASNPLYERGFGPSRLWEDMVRRRATTTPVGGMDPSKIGAINTLEPVEKFGASAKEVKFLDKINPANRAGVLIVKNGNEVVYNTMNPFWSRSLGTHAKNIAAEAQIIGNAKLPKGTGKALGSAAAIWQLYRQYKAATGQLGNNKWDKEYGESDPLSLRPLYDAALGTGDFKETINNPEWAQRNPLAAAVYGGATGGNEYSQAFLDAYVPEFLKQKQ